MTIEIPNQIELLPVIFLILGIITARLGDGPSIWMLVSAVFFILSIITFLI